ncbi:MAG: POTRA domain-containing protein, partial [Saprospiraceae bacterium]
MKLPILGLLLLFAGPLAVSGQIADTILPTVAYDVPKEYEIGGVRVTGTQYADAGALISITGFRVGEKIRIPGNQFAKAVQALWNLHLFTDVQINQERRVGDVVFLEIAVQELPRYSRHSFIGVKKNQHDDMNAIVNKFLQKGAILTDNIRASLIYALENHYVEKGYLNARVEIKTYPDEKQINAVRLEFIIDQRKKVKIQDITFHGNEHVKDKTLLKKMKGTHEKRRIFKKSKLVRKTYEEDKRKIETYYNTIGYRDARIVKDSISRDKKGSLLVDIYLNEGNRYYFRNLVWKG